MPDQKLLTHIRWLVRKDLDEVMSIENRTFEFPWSEEDLLHVLRQRNVIGMVAERQELVAGYMIYELFKNRIHVLNFAVEPNMIRQGIGRQMAEKLINKLSMQRRKDIVLEIRESNLDGQLFFRSMGFKATGILRNHYDDSDEDAFQFAYEINDCDDDPRRKRMR